MTITSACKPVVSNEKEVMIKTENLKMYLPIKEGFLSYI